MSRKLTDADRAAVDLLFDRISTTGSSDGKDGVVAMTPAVGDANLQAVGRVLDLLGRMPAPEPSADLATRTLQRVSRATGTVHAMPAHFINPNQPHA